MDFLATFPGFVLIMLFAMGCLVFFAWCLFSSSSWYVEDPDYIETPLFKMSRKDLKR